jgi:hypothetical protein
VLVIILILNWLQEEVSNKESFKKCDTSKTKDSITPAATGDGADTNTSSKN